MPTPLPRLAALSLLLVATPALADSPFDGTWKAQMSSLAMQAKPDGFLLKNGTYSCSSCIPAAYSVPADGAYHAVKGRDYWDEVAVTMADDHQVKFSYRRAGKVVGEGSATVSPDGNTLTMVGHNNDNASGVPVEFSTAETRIGAPVAGAHLMSGQWKSTPPNAISDQAMTMTLMVGDGTAHVKYGTGETIDAKIGGPYAPNVGDPGKTMTKVVQPGPRMLEMTDMRGGKVVQVSTLAIQDDGTLKGSWKDPRDGSSGSWVASKQ